MIILTYQNNISTTRNTLINDSIEQNEEKCVCIIFKLFNNHSFIGNFNSVLNQNKK